jgi:hypothetical protein
MAQVPSKEPTGLFYPLCICCAETYRSSYLKKLDGQIVCCGLIHSLLGEPGWPQFAFKHSHCWIKDGKNKFKSIGRSGIFEQLVLEDVITQIDVQHMLRYKSRMESLVHADAVYDHVRSIQAASTSQVDMPSMCTDMLPLLFSDEYLVI